MDKGEEEKQGKKQSNMYLKWSSPNPPNQEKAATNSTCRPAILLQHNMYWSLEKRQARKEPSWNAAYRHVVMHDMQMQMPCRDGVAVTPFRLSRLLQQKSRPMHS